ncbi:MAG: hypothetical protein EXS03_03380 [Phycisphaerales bacterium]|nr:hypothetical protein [Phycisphaerales bacterium]
MTDPERTAVPILEWVLQSGSSPAITLTTWIAKEIEPSAVSAIDLMVDPKTPCATLLACKDAFKHLTLDGETVDDRTLGAVYYAASIAAAMANHRTRITRQSSHALEHAFRNIWIDESADLRLRDIAWRAFFTLRMGLEATAD